MASAASTAAAPSAARSSRYVWTVVVLLALASGASFMGAVHVWSKQSSW